MGENPLLIRGDPAHPIQGPDTRSPGRTPDSSWDRQRGHRGGARPGRIRQARAAATFLLARGITLEDVKQLLGHSSITLTSNTYGHVLEQRQRQVARAMDAVLGG
jgi:integrase